MTTPDQPEIPVADLTVFITDALQGHRRKITRAIALMQRAPTGRLLAQTAAAADYGVILLEENARHRGETDHRQRLVFLRRDLPVQEMALTLAHELAHVSQKVNAGLAPDLAGEAPLQSLMTFTAMEADARAYETRLAYELQARGEADIVAALAGKLDNPLVDALVRGLAQQETTREAQRDSARLSRIMAASFKAFYGHAKWRGQHEDMVMAALERYVAQGGSLTSGCDASSAGRDLQRKVETHGHAYLGAHVDLSAPPYAAVSQRTAARLAALGVTDLPPVYDAPAPASVKRGPRP